MDPDHVKTGVNLGQGGQPDTALWDTNGDGRADVLRWQKGDSEIYEKLDTDYDGYWNLERVRRRDGSSFTRLFYPEKAYGTASHHRFFPLESAPNP